MFTKFDLNGFKWTGARFKNKLSDCLQLRDYDSFQALIIKVISNDTSDIQNIIKSCRLSMSPNQKIILNLAEKKMSNEANLKKILSQIKLKKQREKWVIDKWHKKQNSFQAQKLERGLFVNYINSLKSKKNIKLKEMRSVVEKIEKSSKSLESILLVTLFAIEINNQSWADQNLEKILTLDLKKSLFISSKSENQKDYFEALYYFFQYSLRKVENKKVAEIFISLMSIIIDTPEMKKITADWNVNWSLTEMRELSESITLGRKYLGAWVNILYDRVRPAELNSFIVKALDENIQIQGSKEFLWVFSMVDPLSDKIKSYFEQIIIKNKNESSFHYRYMLLKSIESEPLKRIIAKYYVDFDKAQFQIKRKYYLELLASGNATNFAIYNLLELGDRNDDFLWWLVL